MAVQLSIPTSTFRLVRVFLASPGDLGEERRAAREAVDEINKTIARPAGFHVDLIGWEDTISERRRPQEIINEDLQSCEMFVGMMWKKWGTPPDTVGRFTSGFEEEFSLATELSESQGSPVIRLYFKQVDQSLLSDPGEDLKKVLSFKESIEKQKKVYFETFKDVNEFARRMRISIADYINKLRSEMQREQESSTESPRQPTTGDHDEEREQQEEGNLPAIVQARFLADVASEITEPNGEASAVEVARLRNVANWLSHSQNDQLTLGAHDANILYASRGVLVLSDPEIANLADAGLGAYSSDNLPVWYWVGNRLSVVPDWLGPRLITTT